MNCKALIFFIFAFLFCGCAIVYLSMNFTVRDDPQNPACMLFNYKFGGSIYTPSYCTNDKDTYKNLKNSIDFFKAISGLHLIGFALYLLVHILFYCCIGEDRIISCVYHWVLFNKPEDGGCHWFFQILQGFFMAVFLFIVSPVSLLLFFVNLCCPRQPDANQYGAPYGITSADNMGGNKYAV